MKPLLFFDLETVPDADRLDTFGLPPLQPYVETPLADLPSVADFLAQPLDAMKATTLHPPAEWLAVARATENAAAKPRKGALEAIDKLADMRGVFEREAAERVKLLSVTPEYCSVAAFGWAEEDGEPQSLVVGEAYHKTVDGEIPADERDLLDKFWSLASRHTLVGYNIANFDLPVIYARSAILRIRPSCKIDMRPWGNDVRDLFVARFPKGAGGGRPAKLKELAKLYGLVTQAEDVDGGHVYKLMQEKRFAEVAKYVESDVSLVQQMHELFAGLFI